MPKITSYICLLQILYADALVVALVSLDTIFAINKSYYLKQLQKKGTAKGSVNQKVEPAPGLLITPISPP
jgi:hypothetical protein